MGTLTLVCHRNLHLNLLPPPGNTMLTHWTRKILVEEGHSVGQLVHILQLVVRHANVYYPVRHHLTHHITQAMHRLGFTPTANLDQRRLAVDLAEVGHWLELL